MRRLTLTCVLVTMVAGTSGCLKQIALGSVANALSASGNGFGRDDDPELIGDTLPVIIKVMEQLHDSLPKHQELAVALTRATTSYGVAYIADDADRVEEKDVQAARKIRLRARRMLLRARKYGLAALDISVPGLGAALLGNDRDKRAALLAKTKKGDVAALYWTSAAWGAAISNAKDDMELVGQLPQVNELAARALALDESFEEGAIHELYINLAASQNDRKAAKEHFDRAVQLSHDKKLSPLVTYAEAVCVDAQDKKEFSRLLDKVLAFDVDSDPDHRLVNILSQRRARWLMSRIADLFAE
ncbi:MAG TPA: TRAP transporter TatT component family protein [Polyangia bacterium]|nr:TRAP transporter TatT component family protein [Polyangia bacterium]